MHWLNSYPYLTRGQLHVFKTTLNDEEDSAPCNSLILIYKLSNFEL